MKKEALLRVDELKKQIEALEEKQSQLYKEANFKGDHQWYLSNIKPLDEQVKAIKREIRITKAQAVEVGDGITIDLYSDSHAYTIISRTAKRITIQRDKAILNPNFKPEFIVGGFAGHCTNQDEQTYTYEPNPNGEILTLGWSEKWGGWKYPYGTTRRTVRLGRHEFYDYNF